MTEIIHVIGVVVAVPSALCLVLGGRDQNLWVAVGVGSFLALITYGAVSYTHLTLPTKRIV